MIARDWNLGTLDVIDLRSDLVSGEHVLVDGFLRQRFVLILSEKCSLVLQFEIHRVLDR